MLRLGRVVVYREALFVSRWTAELQPHHAAPCGFVLAEELVRAEPRLRVAGRSTAARKRLTSRTVKGAASSCLVESRVCALDIPVAGSLADAVDAVTCHLKHVVVKWHCRKLACMVVCIDTAGAAAAAGWPSRLRCRKAGTGVTSTAQSICVALHAIDTITGLTYTCYCTANYKAKCACECAVGERRAVSEARCYCYSHSAKNCSHRYAIGTQPTCWCAVKGHVRAVSEAW
jgi:hypothetical protein